MSRIHSTVDQILLRSLCWFSSINAITPVEQGLYRTKVFGGPLRGMYFSMPSLERAAFALGTYERHVVDAITEYVKPKTVAYDIGANAGYLTLVMATLVGKQGRVFAFEPDARNLNALEANLRINNLSQVTSVAKAVSNESGTVTFASFDYSLVGHIAREDTPGDAELYQVASTSLDDFVFFHNQPKPDFIKIDVEGAEEHVLRGAIRVLQEVQPVILAEVRSGEVWKHVSELMSYYNYKPRFLVGGWDMEKDNLGDVLFEPLTVQ